MTWAGLFREFGPLYEGSGRAGPRGKRSRLQAAPKSAISSPEFRGHPRISPKGEQMAKTLYDKIFDDHVVDRQSDGTCLLYIDRHLVHEVTSPQAFEGLRMSGRKVRAPEKTLAVVDHNVPTTDRSHGIKPMTKAASRSRRSLKNAQVTSASIISTNSTSGRASSTSSDRNRVSRCRAPRSYVATVTRQRTAHSAHWRTASVRSEVEHVLATQTLIQKKAKNMLVQRRRQAGAEGRRRERHHARHHRRNRDRRRYRLGHRIRRRRDHRRCQHGRPHDGLQHVDRRWRARRHDRTG